MEPPNLSPYEKQLIAKGAKYVTLTRDLKAQTPSKAFCEYHDILPDRLQDLAEKLPRALLRRKEHIKLLGLSSLYTVNIAISNAGLGVVTLPVHQAIRATSPVLTLLLAKFLPVSTTNNYGPKAYFKLLPITAGVILATCGGQYNAAPWGLFLTMIGAVLAVAKTITTNILLRNDHLNLHPVELLSILSLYAGFQAVLWAIWNGEVGVLLDTATDSKSLAVMLLINAAMAAALNVASFEANKRSGPIAMANTANLKQVILLAVPVNGESPNLLVVAGTILTVGGSVWHAHARHQDERNLEFTSSTKLPKHPSDPK